jgi:plastocyanin
MTSLRTRLPTFVVIAAALLVGVLAGCSAKHATAAPPPSVVVHMTEYKFTPADITVPKDSVVLLVNDGQMAHSWVMPKAGVGTGDVQPGASQTLDLSGIAPGTYQVICDLPGHAKQGEVGTVTITA